MSKSPTGATARRPRTGGTPDVVATVTSYERWVDERIPTVASARAEKHALMAADPFGFLRGSYVRWLERVRELAAGPPGPTVIGIGDLHVENFGTWRDAEGRLVWGINDLDEADRLPAAHDLLRLATSALIAQHHHAGGRLAGTNVIAALLDGYLATAGSGGRPFVLDRPDPAPLSPLLPAGHADRWWSRLLSLPVAANPDPRAVRLLLRAFPQQAGPPVLRARAAGMGSRDHLRIVGIAEVSNAPVVREIKARCPAAGWRSGPRSTSERPGDAARILQACGGRSPDPACRLAGSWVLRRLAPWSDRIELTDLHLRADAETLLRAMGAETANLHLASVPAAELRSLTGKPFRRWMVESADRMMADTVADWRAWRAAPTSVTTASRVRSRSW
jgi:Uncharacterized protein conserved in bacteria (DUF2252)